MKSQGSTKN